LSVTELTPSSTNFRIFYDPTLTNALANALQLARTVESDFQLLTGWFGIGGGFGPGNQVTINLIFQGNSGSSNNGYHGDGSSTLNLNGVPTATGIAAVVRMHFVAEFVEVLMDYNNQHGPTTWVAGYSHGEGLSQYCAYLLSPGGYNEFYGPGFENNWINSNRVDNDWVNNTEQTDKNAVSFGCALLYLFYLQYQLYHLPATIIQNGGATLAETYNKLTGRGDAFNPFRSLLDSFYPPGQQGAYLQVVNPFPLLTGVGRRVDVSSVSQDWGGEFLIRAGDAETRAFFNCPDKDYHFNILGQPYQLTVTAKTHGFASASFNWYLNGLALTGSSGTTKLVVEVTEKNPNLAGGQDVLNMDLSVSWQLLPGDMRTSIMQLNVGVPFGQYQLKLDVTATETFATSPDASGTDLEFIDNSRVQWEEQYYTDQKACEAPFKDIATRYVHYHPYLNLLLTLPDPPEEYGVAVRTVRALARELEALQHAPAEVRGGMDKLLRERLGISSTALRGLLGGAGQRAEGQSAD
jgi:hypothetical protein